jgi:P-type Cu2+ transporter
MSTLSAPTRANPRCAHCGLTVPEERLPGEASQGPAFCCGGCETVYHAIIANGLGAYYEQLDSQGRPPPAAGGSYDTFDDADFVAHHTRPLGSQRQVEFYLEGIHCAACVWLIEKLPTLDAGVSETRLNYGEGRVQIIYDPGATSLSAIARRLDGLGYPPHPALDGTQRDAEQQADRALLTRIGIAGAVFGNVMLASLALYSGEAYGMSAATTAFFRWGIFLVATPGIIWGALPFFRGAFAALRTRSPHMDLAISLGILAALLSGAVATLSGSGEIYFDSATMLVFLLLIGRWLQSRQQRAARSATDLMFALAPSTSRVLEDGQVREVQTRSVPLNALVEVRAGESIGVDGVVTEGVSCIDQSLLTGESAPVSARPGSGVHAGTVNLSSRLVIRAERTGRDTRLSQIVDQVEQAALRRAPIVLFANRISSYFVMVVLSLALLTLALWVSSGWGIALQHAVALLIVTCPCALGLATPLTSSVALGQAARRGMLIKGGAVLERLGQKPHRLPTGNGSRQKKKQSAPRPLLVFDKTGTLTQGKLVLQEWTGDSRLSALVRAAESRSAHPIARALLAQLPVSELLVPDSFQERIGEGVMAEVRGHKVCVGRLQFIAKQLGTSDAELMSRRETKRVVRRGLSPLFIAVDGRLVSVAGLGDPLRPDARSSLTRLQELGFGLAILSGDHEDSVSRVARELGLTFETVLAQQTPEMKLRFVEEATRKRQVLMVGDGVNDAASLSAASVGIAMHGGAEASLAAADVFSQREGLEHVTALVEGSRRALRVIRQNLGFSVAYNAVAAALAMGGWIHPLIAAVLMPLSSLTVLTNAMRTRYFNDRN